MAVLPTSDIDTIWAKVMSDWSASRTTIAVNKNDLHAAFVSIDSWIDKNIQAMIDQLPAAAKALPTSIQLEIFKRVAAKRQERA